MITITLLFYEDCSLAIQYCIPPNYHITEWFYALDCYALYDLQQFKLTFMVYDQAVVCSGNKS